MKHRKKPAVMETVQWFPAELFTTVKAAYTMAWESCYRSTVTTRRSFGMMAT
jgi:hypothetical protein